MFVLEGIYFIDYHTHTPIHANTHPVTKECIKGRWNPLRAESSY